MFHSTTILAVRHRDHAVLAGDGQVTFGQTVVKHGAKKIRRLYNDRVLAGFAGSAADSFALFSRFEAKLEQYRGNLERSAVELAKDWRSDRILRRLEAMLIVLDRTATFLLSGNGDLIEPDDGIVAIGSGGPYALAAAKALAHNTELDGGTFEVAAVLLQLGFEAREQREGVGGGTRKAGQHPVVVQPPDFLRAVFDHRLAEGDLAVAGEHGRVVMANGEDCGAVKHRFSDCIGPRIRVSRKRDV